RKLCRSICERKIMQDWLAATAQVNPQKTAIVFDGDTFTYRDLDHRVNVVAARMAEIGIQEGDHVGVLLPNCPEYIILIHALARLRAIMVPLNTRLTPDELTWQVERAHCKVVICKDDASSRVGNAVEVSDLILSSFESQLSLTRQPEFDLQSVQAIVFTSGTTGKPKGAQDRKSTRLN